MKNIARPTKVFYVWNAKNNPDDLDFVLNRPGASLELYGVFLGKGTDAFSLTINVAHKIKDTKSRLVVRGVLKDSASVEFRGNVKIHKGARRSDAHLEAKAILLSEYARTRLEPYLEIDENDVKATHSTYAGPLDGNEIFYLRSRGFPEETAKKLLVEGFLSSVAKNFPAHLKREIVV